MTRAHVHILKNAGADQATDLESLWRSTRNQRLRDLERLYATVFGCQILIPDLLKKPSAEQEKLWIKIAQLLRDLEFVASSINAVGIVKHSNHRLIDRNATVQEVITHTGELTSEHHKILDLLVKRISKSQLGLVFMKVTTYPNWTTDSLSSKLTAPIQPKGRPGSLQRYL